MTVTMYKDIKLHMFIVLARFVSTGSGCVFSCIATMLHRQHEGPHSENLFIFASSRSVQQIFFLVSKLYSLSAGSEGRKR